MLHLAYHHAVEVYQSSLKPVFMYTQTLSIRPCFTHTRTHTLSLDDMRWVYNTYASDWHLSDLSCNMYKVYSFYRDFCIYKSGFLNFHSNNCLSSSLPCPSQQSYNVCHACEWANTLFFLQECRLCICWNDPGPANICRNFWYSWTAAEDLEGE